MEGNPLYCDCNLLWISKWMKQIFTEMKSINIDAAIQVKASLALSRCQLVGSRHSNSHSTNRSAMRRAEQITITHLTEEHIDSRCQDNSAIRPVSGTQLYMTLLAFHCIVNFIFTNLSFYGFLISKFICT